MTSSLPWRSSVVASRRALANERARLAASRRQRVLSVLEPVGDIEVARPAFRRWLAFALGTSLLVHSLVAAALLNNRVSDHPKPRERWVMVNPPPTASAEDRPEPEASPNVSPEPATSKPAPKPKPSKSPTRKTLARAESAELVPPPKPVVPVVGLSFESTVTGGSGPGFAVGDTRMGQTAATASRSPSPDAPRSAGFNERATVRPGAGGNLVLPGRLREVDPDYPADLRALGIEANVVVRVDIDRLGAVTAVRLVKRAKDDAFNRAAREAAFRERFSPATVDGSATAYRLSFTYRFRLDG